MPFTLSHPAVVLPLAKRGLPLSALVVGSMAPDLPYFILPSGRSVFSHSWQGSLLLSLPVGLLTLWLFHGALKLPVLSLLPQRHREKLAPHAGKFRFGGWRRFLLILVALLIGIYSHLALDILTHYYGWEAIAQLRDWSFLVQIFGQGVPGIPNWRLAWPSPIGPVSVFDWMQNGSSLIGMGLLIWWYFRWLGRDGPRGSIPFEFKPRTQRGIGRAMLVVLGIGLLVSFIESIISLSPHDLTDWTQGVARQTVVMTLKIGIAELLLFCAAWHINARRLSKTNS